MRLPPKYQALPLPCALIIRIRRPQLPLPEECLRRRRRGQEGQGHLATVGQAPGLLGRKGDLWIDKFSDFCGKLFLIDAVRRKESEQG